ncbi:hypothetical protein ABZ614_07605 [Streptomyces sp. NPDC013178]|uniref:hypothetical protein n=1 Tax=Streptomyces sp. NPDC013178 TaxID=3155118 RepID=UPI003401FED7
MWGGHLRQRTAGERSRTTPATDPDDPSTAAELHDHLRAALARHKTPRRWYPADALPANAIGEIRKFLLRRQISDGCLQPLP